MTSTSAMQMRESFGDRKVPDISRKIKACVACRKLKIRCHMNDTGGPCKRCKSRGLSCTVNKSLQMLLEGDATWKELVDARIRTLEEYISDGLETSQLPRAAIDVNPTAGFQYHGCSPSTAEKAAATLNLTCSLGAFPATSMTSPAGPTGAKDPANVVDPVSLGLLSQETATELIAYYKQHLDLYMQYELASIGTLDSIRTRSSFLLTAICTVAAFCSGSSAYKACSDLYRSEVSRKLFADHYDFDDVRALCVGTLWLSDISATLNGLAVRISAQLDLHRCITKMPHTKKLCHVRTRLFFIVYICDHHSSLVHGRPPMTREWKTLKDPRAFLQSPHTRTVDLCLISQVEFWAISRCVFEHFGADVESATVGDRTEDIQRLNQTYDQWHSAWRGTLSITSQNRDLSLRIFDLYHKSAKLHLYSHVFRGPTHGPGPLAEISATNPLAGCLLDSAFAIIRDIVDGDGGSDLLQQLPSYFGTMLSFASVCLIRAGLHDQIVDGVKKKQSQELLARLAAVLQGASFTKRHASHVLCGLSKGLEAATYTRPVSTDHQMARQGAAPGDLLFDFDAFTDDTFDWSLLAADIDWNFCPDESPLL